jgi:Ion channel
MARTFLEGVSAAQSPRPALSRRFASAVRQLRASHSYSFVLLLILFTFAFAATAPDEPWSRGVLVLLECGTLLTALWTSRTGPFELRLVSFLLTVGVAVVQILTDSKALTAIVGVLSGLLVFAIGVVIVRGIISEGMVSQRSVIGAICVYFLLGMMFLFAYGVVAVLQSGPFFAQGTDGTLALRLYFSFVTLATVGYGDYTTATNLGHMLSVLEALIGQLYLVTVIAVLVSRMHFEPRRRTDKP